MVLSAVLGPACKEDEAEAPALQWLWSQEERIAAERCSRSQSMALQYLLEQGSALKCVTDVELRCLSPL